MLGTGEGVGEGRIPGDGKGAVADLSGGFNRPPLLPPPAAPTLLFTTFDNLSDNASLLFSPSDTLKSDVDTDVSGNVALLGCGGTAGSALGGSRLGVEGGELNLNGGTFVTVRLLLDCEAESPGDAVFWLGGPLVPDKSVLELLSNPESSVRPPVKPSIDLAFGFDEGEAAGVDLAGAPVSCLMSMSGLGGPAERALPFEYDDMALPGRRGGNSLANGALSESESSLSELDEDEDEEA
jgi:hypothetical protein